MKLLSDRAAAICHDCGDVIQSKHQHDFVTCKCGHLSIDGGKAYTKLTAKNLDDLTVIEAKDIGSKWAHDQMVHWELAANHEDGE